MRFSEAILDEIRTRLPVSAVVSRKVALKRAGREMRGLSPFKNERTPSFFVNDHKGSWFDFSSGQNGDIFKFLMLTEGIGFPEAVERLAGEVGVTLPAATQHTAEENDERERAFALLETAALFFETQIAGNEAVQAYLTKRGLAAATVQTFRLGYAPDHKSSLKEHLAKAGFTATEITASGLVIHGPDIPVAYDRFRHRVMFPIADLKGRVIAFGGRALDPEAPAKYLNSPETALFHKGNVLFNAHAARAAATKSGRVIAVEGYMDAIALVEAGFPETVASLGTALTETQVRSLWRLTPEPVLCFDGDQAGRNAAFRAVETVLPHLTPGLSVQFAFLPEGLDPDDYIRQHGPAAFTKILGKAAPLFDVLMQREESRGPVTTPEQRSALEARLKAAVARIGNETVRGHYEAELGQVLAEKRRATRRAAGGRLAPGRRDNAQLDWRVAARARERERLGAMPIAATLGPKVARSNALQAYAPLLPQRETLLVYTLLNHPWMIEPHCDEIARMTLTAQPLIILRDALLAVIAQNFEEELTRATLREHLVVLGREQLVEAVERAITHKADAFADVDARPAEVDAGWCHALALHEQRAETKQALDAAEAAYRESPTDETLARILEISDLPAETDQLS